MLRNRTNHSMKILVFCAAAFALVAPVSAELARVDHGPSVISFQAQAVAHAWELRVTGPGDFAWRTASVGDIPSFDTSAHSGLADGFYKWELVAIPEAPRGIDRGDNGRNQRRAGAVSKAMERRSQSGSFKLSGGAIVDRDLPERTRAGDDGGPMTRDQQILDDLIVDGSACIGQDCVNGESFGFDTLRLKENNLRLHFQDTSNSASFPTFDWRIVANESSNGGLNKFTIECTEQGRNSMTIEGCAPTNALYVDSGGNLGFGTANPVVNLHVVEGNTPTLRLEQDGSSGFTPQTWDLAGNEANLFIRDATNGSKLPFRVFPNAPSNALNIEGTTGDVGVGLTSPTAPLHVRRDGTTSNAKVLVENTVGDAAETLFEMVSGPSATQAIMRFNNTPISPGQWDLKATASGFLINLTGQGTTGGELVLRNNGNLEIEGTISSGGTPLNVPDYVFEPDYKLLPLPDLAAFIAENKHLPNVPSADEVKAKGKVNLSTLQMTLLEKIEELTLYTLDQHEALAGLSAENEELRARLAALEARLDG